MALSDQQRVALDQSVDGLTYLADAYRVLFDYRLPGGRGYSDDIAAPSVGGSRPPASLHVLDLIGRIEQLAVWCDQWVHVWGGCTWGAYERTVGAPNPRTVRSLVNSARELPVVAETAGDFLITVAEFVVGERRTVEGLVGVGSYAELAGECPRCGRDSLVRLVSPGRTACAVCPYVVFKTKER